MAQQTDDHSNLISNLQGVEQPQPTMLQTKPAKTANNSSSDNNDSAIIEMAEVSRADHSPDDDVVPAAEAAHPDSSEGAIAGADERVEGEETSARETSAAAASQTKSAKQEEDETTSRDGEDRSSSSPSIRSTRDGDAATKQASGAQPRRQQQQQQLRHRPRARDTLDERVQQMAEEEASRQRGYKSTAV